MKRKSILMLSILTIASLNFNNFSYASGGTPSLIDKVEGHKPTFVNDVGYRKVDVTTYKQGSDFMRVSDTVNTYGSQGGEIYSEWTLSFGTEISGSIYGLNINTSSSITSRKGYSLKIGPNESKYMAYQVVYEVETGYREKYDIVTGKVYSRNKYKVKRPINGVYRLIND